MERPNDVEALEGTKARLVEAAIETLKRAGFAGASAREIAKTGDLNQALVFYHFGSVQNLLLAALDSVSSRRMRDYGERFQAAQTVQELAALAREIYDQDLENGYVTVLGEMVAGGVSNPALGAQVVARVQPWIDMVERKLVELVGGSLLERFLPPRETAFAIVALYLGIDMLSHLERDQTRAQALLDLGNRNAPLADMLLGGGRKDQP